MWKTWQNFKQGKKPDKPPDSDELPNNLPGQSQDLNIAPPSNIHRAILAFRSITTMLSHIQCPTQITEIPKPILTEDQHYELRLLDAMAGVFAVLSSPPRIPVESSGLHWTL